MRNAAAARHVVVIEYDHEGAKRPFTVHPHRVLDDRLFGYCEEAGEDRRFKLARILRIEPTGESF